MPIQLIDNFELNSQKPLDNRFVVGGTSSFYQTRYQIVNKYAGLRIWDLNDNLPYVYNGATWSSETSATTIQGVGTVGYVPKFNTTNSLLNSQLFDVGNAIVVGTTSAGTTGFPVGPNQYLTGTKFVVDGHIRINSGYSYYGSGQNLTQLNASNISSGSLNLQRISLGGSSGSILSRDGSTALWISPIDLSVGTASNTTNLSITNETATSTHFLMFSSVTSGNTNAKVVSTSIGGIKVSPGSSQILLPQYWQNTTPPTIPTSTAFGANQPPYSFSGDTNTGIFSASADNLSFSTGGTSRFSISNTENRFFVAINADLSGNIIGGTLRAKDNFSISPGGVISPSMTFKNEQTMGIYRPASGQFGIAMAGKPRLVLRTGSASDIDFYTPSADPDFRVGFVNDDYVSGSNTFVIKSYANTKVFSISGFAGASIVKNEFLNFSINKITSLDQNQSGGNSLIFSASGAGTNSPKITVDNNAYQGNVLSSATFEILSTAYDRILYGLNGGSNAIGTECKVLISNDSGSTWRVISRVFDRPRTGSQYYYSFNCIIPANCTTRLVFEGTEAGNQGGQSSVPDGTPGSFGISLTLFKFGK